MYGSPTRDFDTTNSYRTRVCIFCYVVGRGTRLSPPDGPVVGYGLQDVSISRSQSYKFGVALTPFPGFSACVVCQPAALIILTHTYRLHFLYSLLRARALCVTRSVVGHDYSYVDPTVTLMCYWRNSSQDVGVSHAQSLYQNCRLSLVDVCS